MNDVETLGERLRQRRLALGLSQRELAGDGISASYVSLIEAGKRRPTLDVLEILAGRLRTTSATLRGDEDVAVTTGGSVALDLAWSKIALRAGSPGSAEKYARAVIADADCSGANRLEALSILAAAAEQQGRLTEAIDVLEPLVKELSPEETRELWGSCQLMLCRCYKDVGDLSRAIACGEDALSRCSASLSDTEILLAISLAHAYAERGDLNTAGRLLERTLHRAEVAGSHRNQGAALWNASIVAEAEGRYDDAVALSERALGLFSESDAVRNLGRLRVTYATQLLASAPTEVRTAREQLCRAQDEFELEGTVIEQARCRTQLARCALAEGDLLHAETLIWQARDIVSDGPEAEYANVELVRGHVMARSGSPEEGLRIMHDAARLVTRSDTSRHAAEAWREVAAVASSVASPATALEALEQAMEVLGVNAPQVRAVSTEPTNDTRSAGDPEPTVTRSAAAQGADR